MRSSRLRAPALVSALVVVAAACGSGGASTSSPGAGGPVANEEAGERASATFTADQLDGGEFASTSLAGKDTVLWFWAPWCTVCRGEAPDVVASAEALAGRVEIIGVAGRGGVPEMHDFVSDTDTGSLTHVVDADGSIWSQYGVFAQPAYAFIDDGGEVEVFVGAMGEEALTERMNALAEA